MTIYTSYYRAEIRGEGISISLYPPKNWKGKHLPLFAPTPELLKWWKASAQDAEAEKDYERRFREILHSRQQLIDLWVRKQQQVSADITLCCFEKSGDFCHRYIVGREVIRRALPELWGGEVGLLSDDQLVFNERLVQMEKGIGLTDTESMTLRSSREHSNVTTNSKVSPKQTIPIDSTFAPTVQTLLSKCYDAGLPVECLRLPCGYYRVSLHGEDLGDWSELGVLAVLSGLQQEFYRGRLVRSLAAGAVSG